MTNYWDINKERYNKARREKYSQANDSINSVIQLPIKGSMKYDDYFTYNAAMEKDDYLKAVNNSTFERAAEFQTRKSKIYNGRYTECQQKEPEQITYIKPPPADPINLPYGSGKLLLEKPTSWAVNGHTFSYNTDFKN